MKNKTKKTWVSATKIQQISSNPHACFQTTMIMQGQKWVEKREKLWGWLKSKIWTQITTKRKTCLKLFTLTANFIQRPTIQRPWSKTKPHELMTIHQSQQSGHHQRAQTKSQTTPPSKTPNQRLKMSNNTITIHPSKLLETTTNTTAAVRITKATMEWSRFMRQCCKKGRCDFEWKRKSYEHDLINNFFS